MASAWYICGIMYLYWYRILQSRHWLQCNTGVHINLLVLSMTQPIGKILIHPMYAYYIVQARGSSIVFVSTFLTFMAIGGFPAFVEDIKV